MMKPKDVMNITTKAEFEKLLNELLLTDRQRTIFRLKYERGLRNVDIANELEPAVHQDTVGSEVRIIRMKLAQYSLDNNLNK